jgi:hypothetical protein
MVIVVRFRSVGDVIVLRFRAVGHGYFIEIPGSWTLLLY